MQELDVSGSGDKGRQIIYLTSGESEWRNAPYGNWNADNGKANVNSNWTDNRNQSYAAPVVWECLKEKERIFSFSPFYLSE